MSMDNKATHLGGFLHWEASLQNQYYLAFYRQRAKAKDRGIGWELTFQQWLDFWGEDISKRGSGKDDLQMQRLADRGPYALGNIRKGTPKQNSVTAGHMKRFKAVKAAHSDLERRKDAMMHLPSAPPYDEVVTSSIAEEYAAKAAIKTYGVMNKFM